MVIIDFECEECGCESFNTGIHEIICTNCGHEEMLSDAKSKQD